MDRIPEGRTLLRQMSPKSAEAVAVPVQADFDSIFREQFTAMVRLAHLLGSDDPENAAQEAFSRLHVRLPALTEPDRAVGYLRTCLVNITRSRRTHLAVAARYQPVGDTTVASAESTVVDGADRAVLIAALGRLSLRHREALVLRYWLDLSEKQMAEAMGASVGTVKSHVSRGLAVLRLALPPTDRGQ